MGKRGPTKEFPHQMWVQVTNAQIQGLRHEAALAGTSVSEVVRQIVNERLSQAKEAS